MKRDRKWLLAKLFIIGSGYFLFNTASTDDAIIWFLACLIAISSPPKSD